MVAAQDLPSFEYIGEDKSVEMTGVWSLGCISECIGTGNKSFVPAFT